MTKSEKINLSFPYDWSNPKLSDEALIYNVLENTVYSDLVRIMIFYGTNKVMTVFNNHQWDELSYKILLRMTHNAIEGLKECD